MTERARPASEPGAAPEPPCSEPEPAPALRALLVGIDRYPEAPGEAGGAVEPGGGSARSGGFVYPSLYGAVGDVARVEQYLRETLELPAERISKLVAPHVGGDPARLPTHANLTAALAELVEACGPGEQALVYYSGHGGRAPTLIPEIKGPSGLDEVLAPADVADPGVPYLRDVEIAAWLGRCEAKGVFVTLILDCCHSGGAVRRDRRVRGSDLVDRTQRPTDRLLATREEIAAVWRQVRPGGRGDRIEVVPVRAQAPTGYALLAACRPQERAVEVEIGGDWRGVMTDALLGYLRRADEPGLTYRRLHTVLAARLHAQGYLGQTPVVDGEADRLLFGRERLPARRGIEVLEIEGWPGERVRLATGGLHGTRRGERFAIVAAEPPAAADRPAATDSPAARATPDGAAPPAAPVRLAEVEITEVGQSSSWASPGPLSPGARAPRAGDTAILVDPGPYALRRTVGWVGREGGPGGDDESRYGWLRALLADHGDGFLAVAEPGAAADFEIAETGGLLEIRDAGGNPIPNLGPPLPLLASGTARELVRRLGHLARYWNVRALENGDATSAVAGSLRMRIERREPVVAGGSPEIPAGACLRLILENTGEQVLNVAVLDLAPDWSIQQVHPHREVAPWATLEPGSPLEVDLITHLPKGLDEGVDVLAAIAATSPFDLAFLERPALHSAGAVTRSGHQSAAGPPPTDPFGRLLVALGAERPPERVVRSAETAPDSWTTAAVEVRVIGEAGRGSSSLFYQPSQAAACLHRSRYFQ